MMDKVAAELKIDPIELRRKNALRADSITNTGQHLKESVGLLECIEKTEQAMRAYLPDGDLFAPRQVEGDPDKRLAWGFAVAFKNTGLGEGAPDKASAEVELLENGKVEVRISSAEIGQGLVTVLQMITAQELGMELDQVQVLLSDTDLTPDGGPTTGSRQTYISGNAARYAAIGLRDAITSTLAERYDSPPESIQFGSGKVQVGSEELSFQKISAEMRAEGREPRILYEYWAPETTPLGEPGDKHFAYSFAAQAVEVEVDMSTGEVKVNRAIAATDVGTAINPLGLQGQVEGGMIMGIGHALTEEFILEEGQVVTDHLARYRMPSIKHVPKDLDVIIVEDPTTAGPYGAKGVGEISTMPVSPAIVNAVYNATGIRFNRVPIDQDWLARQLREKEG
jgi:xanthine dehydrogenase molybdenum-binding subunit